MSLSHDRTPETAPQVPETSVCRATPARPNLGAADYPIAQGGGSEFAGVVLAGDPLAEFYYEALVQDPIASVRDVLFTCYLHNWTGFNQMLGVVDSAARAELDATDDADRAETLTSLRPGLAAGKAALRAEATPFELDILLGALDPATAPLTAGFVAQVYEGAQLRLAHQLRDHAAGSGDSELLCRAHQLMSLLDVGGPSSGEVCPVEEPTDDTSGWDKIVDWGVSGAGALVDSGVNALADTPVLGDAAAAVAPGMKFGQEFVGGVAKGVGDMVGGLAIMATQPIATLKGIGTMLEHVPGSPLKTAHKLYDVAAGNRTLEESFLRNPLAAGLDELGGDWDFWKQLGGAMLEPYRESIEAGKPGETMGRGVFDVASMFIGAGEIKALGKGAKLASKLDDATLAATKLDGLDGAADDVVRAGVKPGKDTAALTADVAKRLADGLPTETLAQLGARLTPDAMEALARGLDAETLARIAGQLDADTLTALLGKGLDGHAIRELVDGVSRVELKNLARTASAPQLLERAGALAKSRLSSTTAELRALHLKGKSAPAGGNAAAAELTLDDGTRLASKATSKAQPMEQPPTASMGPDPSTGRGGHYEPTAHADEGWIRLYDSEYKILSDLTDRLRAAGIDDPFGTLRLYTERAPCDSCASILREFHSRYPHVKIEVYNDFTVEGVAL